MKALLTALALALGLTLVVGSMNGAEAYHGDRIGKAAKGVVGHSFKNKRTKVVTTIIGTYPFKRRYRGHTVTLRGIRVSVQRCFGGECHGAAKEANLWAPHHLGKPLPKGRTGAPETTVSDVCVGANSYCGAPWNWLNKNVEAGLQAVTNKVVKPCELGALAGYGLKVSEGLAGKALAEGAALGVAKRATSLLGPEGWAVGTLGGCFFGIGVNATGSVKALIHALNPFDKVGDLGARRQ